MAVGGQALSRGHYRQDFSLLKSDNPHFSFREKSWRVLFLAWTYQSGCQMLRQPDGQSNNRQGGIGNTSGRKYGSPGDI